MVSTVQSYLRIYQTDARVQSVTESELDEWLFTLLLYWFSFLLAMQVIRMVKLFGWEPQIADRIHTNREDELYSFLKTEMSEIFVNILKCVKISLSPFCAWMFNVIPSFLLPIITMVVTFATYVRDFICNRASDSSSWRHILQTLVMKQKLTGMRVNLFRG